MNLELAKNLIIKHEGWRAKPYKCPANKLTIGYGFNIEDEGLPKAVGHYWLEYLLTIEFIPFLKRTFLGFENFSENRKQALLNMVYNMGESRFLEFRKMIKAINENNWQLATAEAENSKWAKLDVPKRAAEVVKLLSGFSKNSNT